MPFTSDVTLGKSLLYPGKKGELEAWVRFQRGFDSGAWRSRETAPLSGSARREDKHELARQSGVLSGFGRKLPGPGKCSPVAVVVVIVITSQSRQTTQADGIGEKDLRSSIYPDLQKGTKKLAQREVRYATALFSENPIRTHTPMTLDKGITKPPNLRNVLFRSPILGVPLIK